MSKHHYKRIVKLPAKSYNDFCWKLRERMIYDVDIKCAGCRYKFYYKDGNIAASYDERKDYGLIYDYDNHSELNGKILYFNHLR